MKALLYSAMFAIQYPRLLLQRDSPFSAICVRKADPSALTAGRLVPSRVSLGRACLAARAKSTLQASACCEPTRLDNSFCFQLFF